MDKPSKRKPAKPTLTSQEAIESKLNRKLPKSMLVPVQPAPLEQSKVFAPPVRDLDTAPPAYDRTSNVVALSGVYPDEGYNYGDRYGGYHATRFNSTQVDDQEADAMADYRYHQVPQVLRYYRYHQYHHPTPALEYVGAYSALYSDPNAQVQGLPTSHDEERIMERMERHSSASSKQLQAFIGQGEFFSIISLKFLKIYLFAL
jgi:hypothetical protein